MASVVASIESRPLRAPTPENESVVPTERLVVVKEGSKYTIEKQAHKLQLYWKGTSLHYPFTFRKVYTWSDEKNGSEVFVVCEEDLSKKVISFSEQLNCMN